MGFPDLQNSKKFWLKRNKQIRWQKVATFNILKNGIKKNNFLFVVD